MELNKETVNALLRARESVGEGRTEEYLILLDEQSCPECGGKDIHGRILSTNEGRLLFNFQCRKCEVFWIPDGYEETRFGLI